MFLHQHMKPLAGDDSLEGKAVAPSERDQRPSQTPHYADEQTQAVATELEFVYAAPECMHHPQDPDPHVDVYGLAMRAVFVLYERELPFDVIRNAQGFIDALNAP